LIHAAGLGAMNTRPARPQRMAGLTRPLIERSLRQLRRQTRAGLPTAHGLSDLRNSYAMVALADGKPPTYVAEQVGGNVETLPKWYAHWLPRRNRGDAAARQQGDRSGSLKLARELGDMGDRSVAVTSVTSFPGCSSSLRLAVSVRPANLLPRGRKHQDGREIADARHSARRSPRTAAIPTTR
jgi:hypothetical protein